MHILNGIGAKVRLLLTVLTISYLGVCIIAALETPKHLHTLVVHCFIVLALILIARQTALLVFAILESRRRLPDWPGPQDSEPYVSIIAPAFNEEAVITPALRSLLDMNYSNYEVILVDDGSSDHTLERVNALLETHNPRQIPVRIISHTNAGKANALNAGLMHAAGEFIFCVDSDAWVMPDSLRNGLRHFHNPEVGAVAGDVMIANAGTLLTRFQQLEYMLSQNFMRRGMAWFGMVTIVPGPVGLFRRSALAQAHGYREDAKLFAEDADLSVRLLGLGWKIQGESGMQAYTEAPDTIFSLLRQRYRWKRGIYQVLHDNFLPLMTAPGIRRPLIGSVLLVEGFLFEVLGFGVTLFMITNILYLAEIKLLLGWLLIMAALDLLVLLFVVPLRQFFKWLPVLILQKLSYSYALQTWGVLALLDEWRSRTMAWDKLERLGALQPGGAV